MTCSFKLNFWYSASFLNGRFGPRQIRCEAVLVRAVNGATGAAPYESLMVADVGDIPIIPYNAVRTCEIIKEHMSKIIKNGCRPLSIGGDHLVTYPILQAIKVSSNYITKLLTISIYMIYFSCCPSDEGLNASQRYTLLSILAAMYYTSFLYFDLYLNTAYATHHINLYSIASLLLRTANITRTFLTKMSTCMS